METLKNTLATLTDTVRTYPYLACLLGFGSAVSYGVYRLLALLETVQ